VAEVLKSTIPIVGRTFQPLEIFAGRGFAELWLLHEQPYYGYKKNNKREE
jgi:hypothetical protein